jgi:hypothetical protein
VASVNPIQLQKSLKGTKYPASKQALMESARNNGADEAIRSALQNLPDMEYSRPSDVSKAIRGDSGDSGSSGKSSGRSKASQSGSGGSSGSRSKGGAKAAAGEGSGRGRSRRAGQMNDDVVTTPSQAEGDRETIERNLRRKNLQ